MFSASQRQRVNSDTVSDSVIYIVKTHLNIFRRRHVSQKITFVHYRTALLLHTVKVEILGIVIFSINRKRHRFSKNNFQYYVLWIIRCGFIRLYMWKTIILS